MTSRPSQKFHGLIRKSPVLPLLACLLAGPLYAQETTDPVSSRDTLIAYSEGLEGLRARFQQVVISQDGELLDQGSGEFWLQSPDRFRWFYEGDFPELIVADGRHIWIYDESLEQVTVREQQGAAGNSPMLLITNPEGLDDDYQVTELGTLDGNQMLQLKARDADASFERILLSFMEGQLQALILEDSFGLRTEMNFFEVERNPPIPPGHFNFIPPAGVDLLGDVPLEYQR